MELAPEATAVGGRPSLELATQLGRPDQGHWLLSLYPEALEASGTFRYARPWRPGGGRRGEARDPERSRVEAARRAGGRLRRYCVANRLNRLGTLTYGGAGCHDPVELRRDVGEFFRGLRSLVGKALAYAWVPERHPGGHGLHVHFAVARYTPRWMIEESWGRGYVHIKLLGDLPIGSGAAGESRAAARYLAKYVRKGLDEGSTFGLHRFDVAQGFQPLIERIAAPRQADVIEAAVGRMGSAPSYVWRSVGVEGWFGPEALYLSWFG